MTTIYGNALVSNNSGASTLPLITREPGVAVPYLCLLVVVIILGTLGNCTILFVGAVNGWKGVAKVGYEFIVNQALADLLVSAIANPFCIVGVVEGAEYFADKSWLCTMIASLCLAACFCSILNHTVTTMNRYVYICANHLYDRIFKKQINLLLCILVWVVAFALEMPNFFGWGGHFFDMKNHSCAWNRIASFSYTMFVTVGLIGAPFALSILCYARIFTVVWISKNRVVSMPSKDVSLLAKQKWQRNWKSTRSTLIVFIAFLVCWTPYAVVVTLDTQDTFSIPLHLYVSLLAHSHGAVTFIIYWTSNSHFRDTVIKVFKLNKCCPQGQDDELYYRMSSAGGFDSREPYRPSGYHVRKVGTATPIVTGLANDVGYNNNTKITLHISERKPESMHSQPESHVVRVLPRGPYIS